MVQFLGGGGDAFVLWGAQCASHVRQMWEASDYVRGTNNLLVFTLSLKAGVVNGVVRVLMT